MNYKIDTKGVKCNRIDVELNTIKFLQCYVIAVIMMSHLYGNTFFYAKTRITSVSFSQLA